jgi:hypothetical protein
MQLIKFKIFFYNGKYKYFITLRREFKIIIEKNIYFYTEYLK